jgi:predicted aminopeptidase
MGRFYAEVRRLAQLDAGAREAALAALAREPAAAAAVVDAGPVER